MKITLDIKKNNDFKEMIRLISEISVSELTINSKETLIEVMAMDPANVAMLIFKYEKAGFDAFEATDGEKITLSVKEINTVLKRMKSGKLTIETTESQATFTNTDSGKKTFTLPLIDAEERELKEPKLEYEGKLAVSAEEFSEAIEDLKVVGGQGKLVVADNKLSMLGSDDTKNANINLVSEGTLADSETKYSLEYLEKMTTKNLGEQLSLEFKKDYPLTITYKTEHLHSTVIIAPRVDND